MSEVVKNWIGYLLIVITAVILFIIFPNYSSVFPLALAAVMPVCSGIILLIQQKKIHFDVDGGTIPGSKEGNIYFEIYNKSAIPALNARVEVLFRFPMEEKTVRKKMYISFDSRSHLKKELEFVSEHYGAVHYTVKDIWIYDFFRIWAFPIKNEIEETVYMLPPVIDVEESAFLSPDCEDEEEQAGGKFSIQGSILSEYEVRKYRQGDPMKNIHWKLSARTGDMMVKEYGEPLEKAVCVQISGILAQNPEELDYSYCLIYSVALRYILQGQKVQIWPFHNYVGTERSLRAEMHKLFEYVDKNNSRVVYHEK